MERNDGLRGVLLQAWVYRVAQRMIGADKFAQRVSGEIIGSTSTSNIVDIGCGTADIAGHIDFATYTGFDPNPPYVESASARLQTEVGDRATVFQAALGDPTLVDQLPPTADIVLAVGVFHHLDDELVDEALRIGAKLVGDHGRFLAFDPGFVDGQSRIANALITRDRGQHVRTVEATQNLVGQRFSQATVTVRHDLLHVPYTHLVVQASNPAA